MWKHQSFTSGLVNIARCANCNATDAASAVLTAIIVAVRNFSPNIIHILLLSKSEGKANSSAVSSIHTGQTMETAQRPMVKRNA